MNPTETASAAAFTAAGARVEPSDYSTAFRASNGRVAVLVWLTETGAFASAQRVDADPRLATTIRTRKAAIAALSL